MKILLIGGNSFLGKEVERIATTETNLLIWKINRCESILCSHNLHERTICVNKFGKILSTVVPKFECIYLLSTFFSKKEDDNQRIFECNIVFLGGIVDALKKYTKKFIYTNSYLALPNKSILKISYYAESKKTFSSMLKNKISENDIYFDNVYIFDVIGPDDFRKKFLDLAITSSKENITLSATKGNQLISPIHVYDAAKSLLSLFNIPKNGVWELKGPESLSLKAYVEKYEKLFDKKLMIDWDKIKHYGDEIFEIPSTYPNLCQNHSYDSIEEILKNIYGMYDTKEWEGH